MSTPITTNTILVRIYDRQTLATHQLRWETFLARRAPQPLSYHPAWLAILARGLGQVPYCLEALEGEETRGLLLLTFVRSLLFGRFLVGLPYLNYGGVLADDEEIARLLIDQAIALADRLDVRHLELRHEKAVDHPALRQRIDGKVHLRRWLPATAEGLWMELSPKVRNQVRKGQKSGLTVAWGGAELLPEFYAVFSQNMRDLGTPVFGRGLFLETIRQFSDRAEFCVVRAGEVPVAAALLLHGQGVSEVPSASSLRSHNQKCPNMLMYWSMLERAIRRGQGVFDFGRSSPESNTYRFKKQWDATPSPAEWQYYMRVGSPEDMRPENPRYRHLIHLWKRLPVALTRWLGPPIVRGIP